MFQDHTSHLWWHSMLGHVEVATCCVIGESGFDSHSGGKLVIDGKN